MLIRVAFAGDISYRSLRDVCSLFSLYSLVVETANFVDSTGITNVSREEPIVPSCLGALKLMC